MYYFEIFPSIKNRILLRSISWYGLMLFTVLTYVGIADTENWREYDSVSMQRKKEAMCWMNTNNTATWRMYAFSIIVACLHFNDTHGLNGLIIINSIYSIDLSKIAMLQNVCTCYLFIIRWNYFGYLSNDLNKSLLQMVFIQILFLGWQKINRF